MQLMKSVGNEVFNSIWEANIPDLWVARRPDSDSDGFEFLYLSVGRFF